jgi:hypothetical protein
MKLLCGFMRETYSGIHLEIIKVSLVTVKLAIAGINDTALGGLLL